MSANDSHESPIKTPTQLVTVVVLAFVVPIVIIVLLVHLVTGGMRYEKDSLEMSPEAIAKRIQPVANINIEAAARGGQTARSGEDIYKSVCTACHATGVANAPKFGNKGDWAPRIQRGRKALVQSALKGKGAMPPRGGAADLSDAEVERAVVYMADAGGAAFKEPAALAAAPAAASKPDGKKVYESTCIACHGTGVANAPKFGSKADWGPRAARGIAALYQSALHGKGAMPPKGGNSSLSEADVKSGVDYMVGAAK
jgi:cytochrome c5